MSKGNLNVAIAGAGMGGLAVAAALRKAGLAVTVYEQARQFTRLGAGIQIGCNAMHVLRGLGLESLLRAETFYPRSWNNRHWKTGEVLFDMVLGPSAEAKYGAPYLLAHRGDLHEALASIVPPDSIVPEIAMGRLSPSSLALRRVPRSAAFTALVSLQVSMRR